MKAHHTLLSVDRTSREVFVCAQGSRKDPYYERVWARTKGGRLLCANLYRDGWGCTALAGSRGQATPWQAFKQALRKGAWLF